MPYAIDPEAPLEYILSQDRNLDPEAENRTVFDVKVLSDEEIETVMRYINIANRVFKKTGLTQLQNEQFVKAVTEIGIIGWVKFKIEDGATIPFSTQNLKYLLFPDRAELCQAVISKNQLELKEY